MPAPAHRYQLQAPPPKWLRLRLSRSQVQALHLVHVMLLDDLANGHGTEETLWHMVEAALTWSHAAAAMGEGEPQMAAQLELATRLVERYAATRRVELQGTVEYDALRIGSIVMDLIAERVDQRTAEDAAQWSRGRVVALQAAAQRVRPLEACDAG